MDVVLGVSNFVFYAESTSAVISGKLCWETNKVRVYCEKDHNNSTMPAFCISFASFFEVLLSALLREH